MSQLIGKVKVVADGQTFRTKKGSKLETGGIERTVVMDNFGKSHHSEEFMPSVLEFTTLHTSDFDAQAIHALVDVTFNYIADNGIQYVCPNMKSLTPPTITDDGECAFKFSGDPAVPA